MVQFNELRITPDGQKLIIDVSVQDLEYYANVYLDSILIDTQDTFTDSGPSSKVVYKKDISGDAKSIRLELGAGDLLPSLNENLFFIYVKTKGIPGADTPCGMDNSVTVGVVLNEYLIYNSMLQYIKELEDDCNIPKRFIDKYLRYKAFEISVVTKHYIQAIKYYNSFIKNSEDALDNNCECYNCGCYG